MTTSRLTLQVSAKITQNRDSTGDRAHSPLENVPSRRPSFSDPPPERHWPTNESWATQASSFHSCPPSAPHRRWGADTGKTQVSTVLRTHRAEEPPR